MDDINIEIQYITIYIYNLHIGYGWLNQADRSCNVYISIEVRQPRRQSSVCTAARSCTVISIEKHVLWWKIQGKKNTSASSKPTYRLSYSYWTRPSRNSWFTHSKWWFPIVMLVHQRVLNVILTISHIISPFCWFLPFWARLMRGGHWAIFFAVGR